ncbi:MAG: tRNA lysidine(34) synthetase TilS [Dysgonamonadaceae bacterium]|jgi:tRNA(Ile)-lysidine synthase|nr:tRNA lysidine(34) synthetase TilS [Dysgonamonadaceae bacterium]
MISKIKQYIKKNRMLSEYSTIIVGVSGGADSVVLLHILHSLKYNCIAAHCNFHLRGAESMRDEHFASGFSASLGIPFRKIDFNTNSYAHEKKISVEMAARDLRYQWFETLRKEENAVAIAVAHHKDDNIETLFINLIRGAGLKGLTGIKPVNGKIVRPLLCLSKEDVIAYAEKNKLNYVIDSTNREDNFIRNKIRLQVVPLLKTINQSLTDGLSQTMENLIEAEKVYDYSIEKAISECFDKRKSTIYIPLLKSQPSPEVILHEILKNYGFGREIILNIAESINSQSGKEFFSDEYRVVKDRQTFILTPIKQMIDKEIYLIEKTTDKLQEPVKLSFSYETFSDNIRFSKEKNIAYFDEEKLSFPLTLRKWQKGDRFMPFGMKDTKKLSDYFSDRKFSLVDKENAWVLCSGNTICWIVGERSDDRFKVDYSTKRACIVKLY